MGTRRIAQEVGVDRKTVRRYLREEVMSIDAKLVRELATGRFALIEYFPEIGSSGRRLDQLAIGHRCEYFAVIMRAASDVVHRFRDELAGEDAFLAIVDAGRPTADYRLRLADWACRTLTALTLEAADAAADAVGIRGTPAVTLATTTDWEQLLGKLVDRVARESEVVAFERGDYKALVTVRGVDDCALAIATRAAAGAIDLPAVEFAARLVLGLIHSRGHSTRGG